MDPLCIDFVAGTSLVRERDRASMLPIVRNGPPGTFVACPGGLRISLPTDQIVSADDARGFARVAFGGMVFSAVEDGYLVCHRVRELAPEESLSPERSHVMRLDTTWVAAVTTGDRHVWRPADR